MADKDVIRTDRAPGPFQGAPYNQAIRVGDLVFVAGQLGIRLETGELAGAGGRRADRADHGQPRRDPRGCRERPRQAREDDGLPDGPRRLRGDERGVRGEHVGDRPPAARRCRSPGSRPAPSSRSRRSRTSEPSRLVVRDATPTTRARFSRCAAELAGGIRPRLPSGGLAAMEVESGSTGGTTSSSRRRRTGRWWPSATEAWLVLGLGAARGRGSASCTPSTSTRGLGTRVGRALMARRSSAPRRGFTEAILWVLEDNPRTRRFYELAAGVDGGVKVEEWLERRARGAVPHRPSVTMSPCRPSRSSPRTGTPTSTRSERCWLRACSTRARRRGRRRSTATSATSTACMPRSSARRGGQPPRARRDPPPDRRRGDERVAARRPRAPSRSTPRSRRSSSTTTPSTTLPEWVSEEARCCRRTAR